MKGKKPSLLDVYGPRVVIGFALIMVIFLQFIHLPKIKQVYQSVILNQQHLRDNIDSRVESSAVQAESMHLINLNSVCLSSGPHKRGEPIIPWQYNSVKENESELIFKDDPNLYEKIADCPPIDVFIPGGIRGHGYCEDAMAYVKYLNSRALPGWVFDIKIPYKGKEYTYFDICPDSPVIFLQHYWDGVNEKPNFIESKKKIYWMPNAEMQGDTKNLVAVDKILCKTKDTEIRFNQWFEQHGNPRNAQVIYTKHTTSDITALVRANHSTSKKNFKHPHFVHIAGGSVWKGTRQVMDCWKNRPDLPVLKLVGHSDSFKNILGEIYGDDVPKNVQVETRELSPFDFSKIIGDAPAMLCASVMEGYGHYINQARAAKSIVITTNGPPMNEFVKDGVSGVLVEPVGYEMDQNQLLGPAYRGSDGIKDASPMQFRLTSDGVCDAVDRVMAMNVVSRMNLAVESRSSYLKDLAFFEYQMKMLLISAKEELIKEQNLN